jgi:hypothetical protein
VYKHIFPSIRIPTIPEPSALPAAGMWLSLKHFVWLFLKFYRHHPLIFIERRAKNGITTQAAEIRMGL